MFFVPGGVPGGLSGKGGGKGDDEDEAPSREVSTRFYELLGVSKDATSADIKKAYHRQAMRLHPDKGGDPDAFKELQRAFEVLSDEHLRRRYDRGGEEALEESGALGAASQDFFSQIFGGKGGGRGRSAGRPKTKDVVRPIWVTLEELYAGVTRQLPIVRKVLDESAGTSACEACDGKGFAVKVIRMGPMAQQVQTICVGCRGTGSGAKMKSRREVLEVFVEKGSPDGHKITVHGKADEAPGCEAGDLVVLVRQQEHPKFLRREADLYLQVELSLAEVLAGFRLAVEHLDGRQLSVRSKPGEVIPKLGPTLLGVKGSGMPIHQDPFNFGNLFLAICIRFPEGAESAALAQLLGESESEEQEADCEEVFCEAMDPLLSAKQSKKVTTQAYDEDEEMHEGIECPHQ